MTSDREKIASRLPEHLRRDLKVAAAAQHQDIQDVVTEALTRWRHAAPQPAVATAGAASFGTWVPAHVWAEFGDECQRRGISIIQGLAQAVRLWLHQHSTRQEFHVQHIPQRKIIANQKGGVGKTALSAGLAQAYAEGTEYEGFGLRVLMIDFDPQGHLTAQAGFEPLPMNGDTLVKHMTKKPEGLIADLVVQVEGERFGNRLHLLPAAADGFMLDVGLVSDPTIRVREATLQQALEPIEADYDVIIIDCPPSLGLAMDTALYYGRHRPGEATGASGVLIPVEAEDSSADAFALLTGQIESLRQDMRLTIEYLGLVVNKYDSRRGFIATSSLKQWQAMEDPSVIGVLQDRKEQREAVRAKEGLLAYAPQSVQADVMREIARNLT
ncbi:ParA family protein [Nocardiopsis sp. NPDC006938]|uniref:ParA family protein n=1 Tax=Nocardiopsis sp. NPDC006938 TaxID=3364337 RepID=UPI0036C27954